MVARFQGAAIVDVQPGQRDPVIGAAVKTNGNLEFHQEFSALVAQLGRMEDDRVDLLAGRETAKAASSS